MNSSFFDSARDQSWLQRPIYHDRVALRSRKAWTAIELALMVAALLAIAITVF